MSDKTSSSVRQACLDFVGDDAALLFADGYDDAILGIAERDGIPLVIYDVRKILQVLRSRDHMAREEAEEFFEFNIAGAWMGDQTPIFLRRIGR